MLTDVIAPLIAAAKAGAGARVTAAVVQTGDHHGRRESALARPVEVNMSPSGRTDPEGLMSPSRVESSDARALHLYVCGVLCAMSAGAAGVGAVTGSARSDADPDSVEAGVHNCPARCRRTRRHQAEFIRLMPAAN